ncbi:MAG: undecaprenyl-diphosphate phosphatase [bacterium]
MSIPELLKYIILGIIQGITEVLPISSSGHVAIAQELFSLQSDQGMLFLILVNIGSLLAVIYHFRRKVGALLSGFLRYIFRPSSREQTSDDFHYCLKIVVASIPLGIIGLTLNNIIKVQYASHALLMVGVGLLVTATCLYLVKDASAVNGRQYITYKDALYIGIGQMFAVMPGLSRSGITTSTALGRKMSMETALVFSFMMYIPASIGSSIKYIWDITQDPGMLGFDPASFSQYLYYFLALVASAFATLFSLKFIFRLFRRGRLVVFSIYTFVLGMIALITGVLAV